MFDTFRRNKAIRQAAERGLQHALRSQGSVTDQARQMRDSLPQGLRGILNADAIGRITPADIPALVRQLTEQMRQIERAPLEQKTQAEERRPAIFGFKGDPDDPIYNGEMIKVTSSNVHSIGYRINRQSPNSGTLLVRFLQSAGPGLGKQAGPMYEYHRVHPAVFDSMRKADSTGKFVWDRLRIRGSVSGHRYQYRLTEIRGGRVPRQAVRYGQNEYFVGRQFQAANVKTGERKTFTSSSPDQRVGRVKSLQLLPGGRRVPLVQR